MKWGYRREFGCWWRQDLGSSLPVSLVDQMPFLNSPLTVILLPHSRNLTPGPEILTCPFPHDSQSPGWPEFQTMTPTGIRKTGSAVSPLASGQCLWPPPVSHHISSRQAQAGTMRQLPGWGEKVDISWESTQNACALTEHVLRDITGTLGPNQDTSQACRSQMQTPLTCNPTARVSRTELKSSLKSENYLCVSG